MNAIKKVLGNDPYAAIELFWDHDIEAPIVCAMRNRCDYEVIELLVSAGADIFAENYEGLTPMQLLVGQGRGGRLIRYEHDVAVRLRDLFVSFGAEKEEFHHFHVQSETLEDMWQRFVKIGMPSPTELDDAFLSLIAARSESAVACSFVRT